MKFNRKLSILVLALILLFIQLLGSKKSPIEPELAVNPTPQIYQATPSDVLEKVTRVIDGDTIEITGGIKVRYIGINAPESVAPGKPVGCFGKESSDKDKELVLGKEVRLEKDISETDKYGRLLRYIYM